MAGLKHRYFVLDPEGSSPHGRASRTAMLAYAKAIATTDLRLSKEMREWVDKEWKKTDADPNKPEDEKLSAVPTRQEAFGLEDPPEVEDVGDLIK